MTGKIKKCILYVLALAAYCICGFIVMTVLNLFLHLDENTWELGLKCGLCGWIINMLLPLFKKKDK